MSKLIAPAFIQKYQTLLAAKLRDLEVKRAAGDPERIQELASIPDAEIMRRWMWIVSVVGAPICFVVAPFVLSVLGTFLPHAFAEFLWITAKVAMAVVFITFLLAIYFTLTEQSR